MQSFINKDTKKKPTTVHRNEHSKKQPKIPVHSSHHKKKLPSLPKKEAPVSSHSKKKQPPPPVKKRSHQNVRVNKPPQSGSLVPQNSIQRIKRELVKSSSLKISINPRQNSSDIGFAGGRQRISSKKTITQTVQKVRNIYSGARNGSATSSVKTGHSRTESQDSMSLSDLNSIIGGKKKSVTSEKSKSSDKSKIERFVPEDNQKLDEEYSALVEVIKGEFDFEFYQMQEEKFQSYKSILPLPSDYVESVIVSRKIDYASPTGIPNIDLNRVLTLPAQCREIIRSYLCEFNFIKRKKLDQKKIGIQLSFESEMCELDSISLNSMRINKVPDTFLKEKHVISLFKSKKITPQTKKSEKIRACTDFPRITESKILVIPRKLSFGVGRYEPLFCKISLYDMTKKEKISEDFNFDLNTIDLLDYVDQEDDNTKSLKKFLTDQPRTIFSIPEEGDNDIMLVLTVYQIFNSDYKPYVSPNKFKDVSKLIEQTKALSHLSHFLQPLAIGFKPLYELRNQKSDRRQKSLIPFIKKRKEKKVRRSSKLMATKFSDEEERVLLLNEGVCTMEMFLIPVEQSYNIFDIISGKEKKLQQIPSSFMYEVSDVSLQMNNNGKFNGTFEEYNKWEKDLEVNFQHSVSFKPEVPYRKFVNNLFVYPIQFNCAGVLGLGVKKSNLVLKVIFRREDSVPSNRGLPSENVILKKYYMPSAKEKNFTNCYFTEAIKIADKKRPLTYFTDEIKLDLPLVLTEKHHLVFVVYEFSEKRGGKGEPLDDDYCGDISKEIIGYAPCLIMPYIHDESKFEIPIYKKLEPGYLRDTKKLKKLKRRKICLSLKFVSSVHSYIENVQQFFRKIGSLITILENQSQRLPLQEITLVCEKINELIDSMMKDQNSNEIIPYLNGILTSIFNLLALLYENRNDIPQNSFKMMDDLFKFITELNNRFPNLMISYSENFFSCVPKTKNLPFASIICEIWLLNLSKADKDKKKNLLSEISKFVTVEKRDFEKRIKDFSLLQSSFWFNVILKSIMITNKKICEGEEFEDILEKLIKYIVNLIFPPPSESLDKKVDMKKIDKGEKYFDPNKEEIIGVLNENLAFFVCDLFNMFSQNLLPMRIVHYYHFGCVFERATKSKLSFIRHVRNLHLQKTFFQVISDNDFFINFSYPLPYENKSHCMIELFIDSVLYVVCNPDRVFKRELVTEYLDLLFEHLFDLDNSEARQSIKVRECIYGSYFYFIEKLIKMIHLFRVELIPSLQKKDDIEILSHLKRPERLKICVIILGIIKNMKIEALKEWFTESDCSNILTHLVKIMRYCLLTFGMGSEVAGSTNHDYYCIKIMELFKVFIDCVIIKLMGNQDVDDLLSECYEFSFCLFTLPKCSELVISYYLTNTIRYFVERLAPKLCIIPIDERWQKIMSYLLSISRFPFQYKTRPVIRDCIDLLITPYFTEINIMKPKLETFVGEDEIIGNNIIFNDGSSQIFSEDSIKAASISKLVEAIVFKHEGKKISESVFFNTHASFTTTLDVLNIMFTLFQKLSDEKNVEKMKAVIMCLVNWVKNYFNTFENIHIVFILLFLDDKDMGENYNLILKKHLLASLKSDSEIDDNIESKKTKFKYRSIIPFKFRNLDETKKKIKDFTSWKDYDRFILQWDAKEIAKQMCLIEYGIFRKIAPGEFFKKKGERSVNIDELTTRFNGVNLWIQNSIILHEDKKKRRDRTKKFIEVLKTLKKLRNYNGVNEIVSVFFSAPIERLVNPDMIPSDWPKVSDREYNVVTKSGELMSHSHSYKRLREELCKNKYAIPFLGLCQTDLIKIEIGNPDYIKSTVDGKEYELINLNKRTLLSQTLKPITDFQKVDYTLKIKKIPCLFNALRDICLRGDFLTKTEIFGISLEYKPR